MIIESVAALGRFMRKIAESIGFAARSFFELLLASAGLWRRPRLVIEQIHFIGNFSLVISRCQVYSSAWCWACKAITR